MSSKTSNILHNLLILIFALWASSVPIHAQRYFPGQWVGDLYLVTHLENTTRDAISKQFFIDEKDNIHTIHPDIGISINFQVPVEYGNFAPYSYWHDNALHALATQHGLREENEDGSKFVRYSFLKWQEGEWHFLGDYKVITNGLAWLRAIPCDNDRFIVVSGVNDLTGNKGQNLSPFARMTLNRDKNEMRLDSSIDHGMDEIREYMSDPTFFRMACNSFYIMTDGFATLVHPNTGLYWVFSTQKATLVRAGRIFRNITLEEIAKNGYIDAILCANPEKDGTVLISAQEESAFRTEIDSTWNELLEQLRKDPNISEQDAMRTLQERQKELAQRNPRIVWYRIHPESGRLEKLGVPPLDAALERGGGKNDEWRPMPDGSVRMGPLLINRNAPNTAAQNDSKEPTEDGKEIKETLADQTEQGDVIF